MSSLEIFRMFSVLRRAQALLALLALMRSLALRPQYWLFALVAGAAQAALTLSPASSVDFGSVTAGQSSTKTFTLSNSGVLASTVRGVSVSGTSFAISANECITTLPAAGKCRIFVTFSPTTTDAAAGRVLTGQLTITTTDTVSGAPVTLSGTPVKVVVTAAVLAVSSSSVDFGSVQAGNSLTKRLTLSNTGNADAASIKIGSLTSPLGVTHSCGTTLAAGASCDITVGFAPKAADVPVAGEVYSGSLSITASVSVSSAPIRITAKATAAATSSAVLALSPTGPLDFGSVKVGETPTKTLTLTNSGNADATLSTIAGLSAPFSLSNGCPTTLRAGATCALTIGFSPRSSDVGATTAPATTISVSANVAVSGSPYRISGTAIASATSIPSTATLVISPTGPIDFGKVLVGQVGVKVVQITNTGKASATLSSFSGLSLPFALKNGCSTTLAAGASCQINVAYSPSLTDATSAKASLQVVASVPVTGAPLVFTASSGSSGTVGLALAPQGPFNFGPVRVGESATTTLQLRNSSASAATIKSIAGVLSPFTLQHKCPSSLAAGASCDVQVVFSPTATDAASGKESQTQVLVVSDPPASGVPYVLTGTAQTGAPSLALAPAGAVDFGAVAIGDSATKVLTLSNTGTGATPLQRPILVPPYSVVSECGTQLVAGGSCKLTLQYQPAPPELITGSPKGQLVIGGLKVDLSGTAVAGSKAALTLTPPGPFVFGPVRVGEIGRRILTLSNTGGNAVTVSGFTGLSKPFAVKHNCPSSLDAGSQCQVLVSYEPTADDLPGGGATAQLTVGAGASVDGSPYTFTGSPAAANTNVPVLTLTPAGPFGFGATAAGTVNSTTLTLTNTGKLPAQIYGFTGLSKPFSSADSCPTFLRPGDNCKVQVRFAPTNTDAASLSDELVVAASVAVTGSPFAVTGTTSVATEVLKPDAFRFDAANGVDLNATVQSNSVTITGITKPLTVQVSNGQYSINGAAYTSAAGALRPGDAVRVRVTAASDYATAATATLTVGGVSADFIATTLAKTFSLSGTGISGSNVVVQPTGSDKVQSLQLEVTLGDVTVSDAQAFSGNQFSSSSSTYQLYVAGLVPSGVLTLVTPTLYLKDASANWVGVSSPLSAYLENVSLYSQDTAIKLDILSDLDFGLISGTEFYIGYGTSDAEMLSSGRYRAFYKVP